jgi:hypothetical protein
MSKKAEQVFEKAENEIDDIENYIRDAADLFHEHEGEMFERNEARELLEDRLNIDSKTASKIIGELVGDCVDPIVQVKNSDGKFVGVVEFRELEGAYGYIDYDDLTGKKRKLVCAECVNTEERDSEVMQVSGQIGQKSENKSYNSLLDKIHEHYREEHENKPEEVKTGATLASGTTVGGNKVIHSGNQSSFNITSFSGAGGSSGQLLRSNGSTANWINLDSSDFLIENRSSDPSSPSNGRIWLRTDL